MMNRLLILLFLGFLLSCQEKTPPQKPNVLFLFADDQRADALGISGNTYIQTPTLDQLAKEGS
ncbi:MAG: sulfatase-like hydrolase/transferase, partial [Cyclobacteriaceae bacterium]|nr:sulfatase-like hydrolase/transferase [Cyclobacteriaceae bacterium]